MAVNSYREDEFMENTDKKKIMRRLAGQSVMAELMSQKNRV